MSLITLLTTPSLSFVPVTRIPTSNHSTSVQDRYIDEKNPPTSGLPSNIPSGRVLAWLQVPAVPSSTSICGVILNTFVFQVYYNSPNGFLRSKSSTDISCIASINVFLLLRHFCRHRTRYDAGCFPGLRPRRLLSPLSSIESALYEPPYPISTIF